jgi:hypothetical protein
MIRAMRDLRGARPVLAALSLGVACAGAFGQDAPARDALDNLARHGFSLQNSFDGTNEGQPAGFSFLGSQNASSVYSADFALKQRIPETESFYASAEGHVASAGTAAQDAWRYRLSWIRYVGKHDLGTRHSLSFESESDQTFATNKIAVEYLFTPTVDSWGIGRAFGDSHGGEFGHLKKGNGRFRWRPFVGTAAGKTLDRGVSTETRDAVFRLIARVRAEVFLDFISKALVLERTTTVLYAEDTYAFLPLEKAAQSHHFLTAGLNLGMNPDVSTSFEYKFGEDSPDFKRIKTFGIKLGIKIGKN